MISRLNKKDFKKQLIDNTKIGNPMIKGTPFAGYVKFGEFGKPFFGDYDESNFQLTKNSSLFPIPYIIQGHFKSKGDSETEVTINIKRIGFGFYWIRLLPLFLLILLNVIYFHQDSKFDWNVFISINLFISLMFLPILIVKQMKKKFVKKFNKIFNSIE